MDVLEAIKARRSVRSYKEDPVPDDLIEKILDAGRWAPTGGNIQPWRFIVVKDRTLLDLLKKVSPGYLGDAPLAIVICSDKGYSYKVGGQLARDYLTIADCSMAATNITLAAHALGLGTCVVKSFSHNAVKELLNIPEGVEPELIVVVGYPANIPKPPRREPLERIVYLNRYGESFKKGDGENMGKVEETVNDYLFELALFLATSAQGCLNEPPLYGPFRLLDALSRLIDLPDYGGGLTKDPFLKELKNFVDSKKFLVMYDVEGFKSAIDEVVMRLTTEAKRRYLISRGTTREDCGQGMKNPSQENKCGVQNEHTPNRSS
ncbi:MAG: nitroreductase family protein [Candidatus Methanomethyliales bacterium]|nr:nitroreductase family protein [Candidatus Methanomethylicales archaeon]